MLHPSYTDLITMINSEAEGNAPAVNSRYSVVLATAKRARQLISGGTAYVDSRGKKPLSIAVEEVNKGYVTIEPETEAAETEEAETSAVSEIDDTMDLEEKE